MKIHGHPQKTDYASPAEWPRYEAQGWWPQADPIDAGHLHVGVTFPIWGEVTSLDPIECLFTLKLHDIPGNIVAFFGPHFKSIVWNDTGTSTPPEMRGLGDGLKEWSGKVTLDFTLGQQPWLGDIGMFPKHGWAGTRFTARAAFDNGDLLEVQLVESFFSALDLSVPERLPSQQGRPGVVLSSRVTIANQTITDGSGKTLGGTAFGVMVSEINDWLPLLPIDQPWPSIINFYNYTSTTPLPDGRFEQILDANLHGTPPNIPPNHGTLLDSVSAGVLGIPNRPLILDPSKMGAGNHKQLFRWAQQRNGEFLSSVLSIPVTVGPSVPPPPPIDPPPVMTTGVPHVVGLSQSAALAALQAARLVGVVVPSPVSTNVIRQTPDAGTVVNVGSVVSIVVPTV